MKAMILAAGFGTRLFPLTIDRTKPAVPFLGKPLVGYVAEYLSRFGFDEIVVNLHHQPESVKKALGDGKAFGVRIDYSIEQPAILGTAGALANARSFLGDSTFLIVNGKIITDIDITAALETHRSTGAIATMVLKPNIKRERFTIVETENGLVKGFGEMAEPLTEDEIRSPRSAVRDPLMFTGIHIFEPKVFDYIPAKGYSDIVPSFYRPALEKGEMIAAHVTDADWYELSTIPRYLDISLAMMGERRVLTGTGCEIAPGSRIRDSILWDNITVGREVQLYRTVIADGVTIPEGSHFENAAVVRAEMVRMCSEIPEKALTGYIQGENYIVPLA
ncbi:MAG TPA: NDP-sugar synthase [Pyrinomonadaceae bacterium]|nr:NDP-sugar synthase [Pyrinomonadaceae bacterium]HMP64953.1 NDP-sugar synthase [Pyrinomonadaceae bacterium]